MATKSMPSGGGEPGEALVLVTRHRSTFASREPLFGSKQELGPFLPGCAASLVARQVALLFSHRNGSETSLRTSQEWEAFFAAYMRGSGTVTDRARAESLVDNFGIPLGNLIRLLDDLACSSLKAVTCDLRRESRASLMLGLYGEESRFGLIPSTAGEDAFIRPRRDWPWRAPLGSATDSAVLELDITPAYFPRFVLNASDLLFGRDREEFEAHSDFEPTDQAWADFNKYAVVQPWIPLDLRKLEPGFWEDADRMDLLFLFSNPLHLEIDEDEDPPYHFNREDFCDIYLETEDRVLTRGGLSLRGRVREEQGRALVQFREERSVPGEGGRIVRQEWERRIQRDYFGDDMPSLDRLAEIARFGFASGAPLPEAKRLLERLIEKKLHDRRENLYLVKDQIIYQKRRRTNLQLDKVEDVKKRIARLEEISASLPSVPLVLQRFIEHVRGQLSRLEEAARILVKYAFRRMISGEAILISQDRWATYEPGAFPPETWPADFGLESERGRGIRVEAELDQNASDQVELSILAIEELIKDGKGNPIELEKERKVLKAFQESLFLDVKTTVQVQTERLRAAGFKEIQGQATSKALVGQSMIAQGQGGFRRGHRYWI